MRTCLTFCVLFVFAAWPMAAQELNKRPDPPPQTQPMRDEDEDVLPQTEYAFNPIQAKKDMRIGDFYSKKGNHRAAAARYLEATRWNPTFTDAFWKLAEAREKLKQPAEAVDAYRKYMAVEDNKKKQQSAQERITELEKEIKKLPLAAESER